MMVITMMMMIIIIIIMALGHLLPSSGLTHPEVSSIVFPGSFCLPLCSVLLHRTVRYKPFCLPAVANSFCSPVFCPTPSLYLILLQSLCLFYNLCKCNTLLFSCVCVCVCVCVCIYIYVRVYVYIYIYIYIYI